MGELRFLGRVSSKDQNLARQLKVAREKFDIPDDEDHVFCDKVSGKNFNRPRYQALKEKRPADFQKFLEKQKGGFISVDAACTKNGYQPESVVLLEA